MEETLPDERSPEPITVDSITRDLRALGLESGETVLVHGSLSSLGWVCGGAPAVVDALQRVIGEDGTIVMPTHSPGNRDPTNMGKPPVPDSWYDTIRERMPPYRPAVTPTHGMGAIAECFRSYPGVRRSRHPQHSFAAWGSDAEFVTEDHSYDYSLGEESPLARVYDLAGDVLFLGTTHATNTSLHLAEYRADLDLEVTDHASAVLVDGDREWLEWEDLAVDDEDFPDCGAAFERERPEAVDTGSVGVGEAKLLAQRPLVDFAVEWFESNRD
ncbi:aminoglycoside N(3)-acetyltransferase [Natronobacterium texcoconense]|uniref:Aminoglycoside 3-N-acetyltransferase n=1 Tax=Natronobacterium texcoconense TaxID=1095778 RepID=A0A1H1F8H4_NATTX|nr:AAC(3) family N-acetyltransferase [Natronobacterium texcoconense]SDQ97251.1 aminoglycoside 3-N-acetyltransferase [Natronobacterium texcoconense]